MRVPAAITVAAAMLAVISCGRQRAEVVSAAAQTVTLTDSLLQCGASDTLRFGHLNAGEQGVRSFVLRNETAEPIVVLDTETNCRCTSFDYSHRPLKTGEEMTVTCIFDSSGEWGWQFKLVKFILSTGEPLRIYVEAEVE